MATQSIWMFSGQGSQYRGMGRVLFREEPVFRAAIKRCDALIRKHSGIALIDELYAQPVALPFEKLAVTHPAIFAVEYAAAELLLSKGLRPDLLLGASLGEFTAACVAGVITPETVIEVIIEHAQRVQSTCTPGFMLAIFGPVSLYDSDPVLQACSDLVGVNFDQHFVVAGHSADLAQVLAVLAKQHVGCFQLPVGFGFHSRNIAPAMYAGVSIPFSAAVPAVPWVSCALGGPVTTVGADFFRQVATGRIAFQQALEAARALCGDVTLNWVDLGPSGTLGNFVKRNLGVAARTFAVMSQFGNDRALVAQLVAGSTEHINHLDSWRTPLKTYMFPGQGAQSKGMGAALFDRYPDHVDRADRELGYSIRALCLEDPDGRLGQTQYTQPAIFVVNALSYLAACEDDGEPQYLAGHSLGEYSALFAAGVFSFETGLKIVRKRGELMAASRDGRMAAVIGLDEEQVRRVLRECDLTDIDIANLNAPTQIVISGPAGAIESAQALFESRGCFAYVLLPVSGAFHSRMMAGASAEFARFLTQFTFAAPRIPVLSNVTALPYAAEVNPADILVAQIVSPVQWTGTIHYLLGLGVKEFVEIGPGAILTQLVKKIVAARPPASPFVQAMSASSPLATPAEPAPAIAAAPRTIRTESLGCPEFRRDYGLKYAYVTGAMVYGIASPALVTAMARAGMMGYFGTGGLPLDAIADAIDTIQRALPAGGAYGMNLLPGKLEAQSVDLFLARGVRNIEAAAFLQVSPALAKFRLRGLATGPDGRVVCANRILAKVSRPEVAIAFLSPVPEKIVRQLLDEQAITPEQARLAPLVAVADDLCIESDSGGHTDMGVMMTLLPAMQKLRDEYATRFSHARKIRIGAAGGIGTPEAAAAAFMLGADFIVTGSINQCSVESGASAVVKDMLQDMNVHDTDYAPAGDMFEMGARVQVLRRGVFFPARANKLYEMYKHYGSLEELPHTVKVQLEEKYFGRTFDDIFEECKRFYSAQDIARAESHPKQKLAFIFRWYFGHATRQALAGNVDQKVNFQVQCGPALGAFNQWVKGTPLESWRLRHVDQMALRILEGASEVLNRRFQAMLSQ